VIEVAITPQEDSMRVALAVLMTLYGIGHLVGFVGSWQLVGPERNIPYRTTLLSGRLHLGGAGVRAMGMFWLFAAVAFVTVAAGALTNQRWWILGASGSSLFSLVLCIVALPETRVGIGVNFLLLALLLVGQGAQLFAPTP
jgi:hypothetical protein